MAGIEIKGIEGLIKNFNSLPSKIHKKILKTSLQEAAEKLVSAVSAAAPYDPNNIHPGYYRKAKGERKMRGKTRAATGAAFIPLPHLKMSIVEDKMNARQGAVRRKVLANFYARFLEDGTSKMQPHKFVEPAIKATEQKLLEDFTADVISQIREEFGA